ncbi:Ig heavy chain Mem5-like [Mobula birostris]|uniref:Ig heavy chain Mem5-like n=1 Tax=Mobula birostris TaxID=1983395 RepID=UPI003B27C367
MMMEVLFLFVTVQMNRVYASKPFSVIPGAVTAEVGRMVELSCELTVFASSVFWYKHRDDEPPVAIKTTGCQQNGCRSTYKKGSGDRTSVLEIRDVRVEDSGSYYCAEKKSYPPLVQGPTLLVGDSSTIRTYMQVFVPPSEVNGSVPLVCLVGGLSSKEIIIYWNISGQITEGWSDPGTLDPDQSYSVRSQVLVPVETWRSGGVCTCIAQVGCAGKTRTTSVSYPTIEPDQDCYRPAAILLGLLILLVIVIVI